MFTGLVECLGTVTAVRDFSDTDGASREFTIEVPDGEFLSDAVLGESISVSGVCLTVTGLKTTEFQATAVEETLRRSTLGRRKGGDIVNLERAMKLGARLGGHIVQGHVDGVATISLLRPEGESLWVTFEPTTSLLKYIVEKGSVCLDGISLTVANLSYSKFSVALIPHTLQVTTAGQWQAGAEVNVEVDVIAKYVERLTRWDRPEGDSREWDPSG